MYKSVFETQMENNCCKTEPISMIKLFIPNITIYICYFGRQLLIVAHIFYIHCYQEWNHLNFLPVLISIMKMTLCNPSHKRHYPRTPHVHKYVGNPVSCFMWNICLPAGEYGVLLKVHTMWFKAAIASRRVQDNWKEWCVMSLSVVFNLRRL